MGLTVKAVRSWLPLVALCAVGCLGVAGRAEQLGEANLSASANPHIRLHAAVLIGSIWQQPDRIIFVCWQNADPADAAPASVRAAVADTWMKHSAVRFTGWTRCAPKSRGIRILVDDSGPHTKGLGRQLDGRDAGMVLNFTFNNWSSSCQATREFCVRSIAVHEFGHALGFAHEQNRAEAPGECRRLAQGTNPDVLLTPYDKSSVMNYCNPEYNNNGILSALDAAAVKELYGAPNSGL